MRQLLIQLFPSISFLQRLKYFLYTFCIVLHFTFTILTIFYLNLKIIQIAQGNKSQLQHRYGMLWTQEMLSIHNQLLWKNSVRAFHADNPICYFSFCSLRIHSILSLEECAHLGARNGWSSSLYGDLSWSRAIFNFSIDYFYCSVVTSSISKPEMVALCLPHHTSNMKSTTLILVLTINIRNPLTFYFSRNTSITLSSEFLLC